MCTNGVESFQEAMVTSSWSVMKFEEEALAKCWVVRNTNAIPEIPNTIVAMLQVRRSPVVAIRVKWIAGIG